ncbi:MAG: hypothetical protein QM655_16630 [Nocardioidaceae bacterium]
MRTTVAIDDNLLEEAKLWAHERHLTLGQLVEESLRLRMLTDEEEPRAFVPLPVFQGSGLLPGADPTKNPWHWEEDEPDENGLYHV